jgi:pimeloyl-ACP methyl ester carboxylesterase
MGSQCSPHNILFGYFEKHFRVAAVNRRAGARADADSYSIEREFEDITAVVDSFSEPVHPLGHSYGAIRCLEPAKLTQTRNWTTVCPIPGLSFCPDSSISLSIPHRTCLPRNFSRSWVSRVKSYCRTLINPYWQASMLSPSSAATKAPSACIVSSSKTP